MTLIIGYYPATYGFENDMNGQIPKTFVDVSNGGGCDARVADNIVNRRKVIELYDPSVTNTAMWNQTFVKGSQLRVLSSGGS